MSRPTFPYQQSRKRVRKGLAATVDALAKQIEERSGRRPTDEEIAAKLAMNVAHIRRARAKSGSVPQ
jgi:DNA-directed RNA polymerase specialized sigma subunit